MDRKNSRKSIARSPAAAPSGRCTGSCIEMCPPSWSFLWPWDRTIWSAFIGFPHEGFRPYSPRELLPPKGARGPRDSIYFRTGTDDAPASVRQWSLHHSILHYGGAGYMAEWDFNLSDWLRVVDFGDVDCRYGDLLGNVGRAREKVAEVLRAGAIPLIQGGDHSTPIAAF